MHPLVTTTVDWPADLRERILTAADGTALDAGAWCRLDTEIGQAFAAAAVAASDLVDGPLDLVVSHGQTVFHWVDGGRARGTLQLGEPAWIAEATGAPVLADLRAADIAAGGEGAPLMSVFDDAWLGDEVRSTGDPIATVNLGGIANLQVVDLTGTHAFDSGPANCLVDAVIARATNGALGFDEDGRLAAAGTLHARLLDELLAHDYFRRRPPKTTGRETFGIRVVDDAMRRADATELPLADLVATLVEFTARTVIDAIPDGVVEIVLSGGGTRNPVLVDRLAAHASRRDIRLTTSAERGVDPDAKESLMFALLGFLSWHGIPVRLTEPARITGSIRAGSTPLRLPEPRAGMASLTVHDHRYASATTGGPPPA